VVVPVVVLCSFLSFLFPSPLLPFFSFFSLGRGFASSRELPHFRGELATLGAERKKPSAESKKWRENVIAWFSPRTISPPNKRNVFDTLFSTMAEANSNIFQEHEGAAEVNVSPSLFISALLSK
jgi:hypothetical protein